MLAILLVSLAVPLILSVAATGPRAPEEYIKALEPSNTDKPVRYNPDRWKADIEIIDVKIRDVKVRNGGVFVDFSVRFSVDAVVEIPYLDFSNGVLGFPYYGYYIVFSMWSYDASSGMPLRQIIHAPGNVKKDIEFSVFAPLLETDPSIKRIGPPGSVRSLDPLIKYSDDGVVSLRWVSKKVLNARTVDGLKRLAESKNKYAIKGVLELSGRNVPLYLTREEASLINTEGLVVKVYGGFMLWSMPGSSTPGGTSIIAWTSSKPIILKRSGETTTSTSTETITPVAGGLEKNLVRKEFTYNMRIQYELKKTSGTDRLDLSLVYTLVLENISSNGYAFIKSSVGDVKVESTDPEVESMIKNQLKQLDYESRMYITEVTGGIKTLIENYAAFASQQGLEGLNYRVESAEYNGVPSIKVKIYGEGPAEISGAEEASYKLNVEAYYDEYIGIPLKITAYFWLKARSGEEVAEGWAKATIDLVKGLEALPRTTTKPGIVLEFSSMGRGLVKFTAKNAKISNLNIEGGTLTASISGEGIGSLIVELPGGVSVEQVVVDEEPVDYIVLASTPSKSVILIPVMLSQHTLSLRFSEPLTTATLKEVSIGEQVETIVEQPAETTYTRASTTTETVAPSTQTQEEYPSTHTTIEKTVEEHPEESTVKTETDMFKNLFKNMGTTLIIALVAIIAIIVAVIAVVIAVARR